MESIKEFQTDILDLEIYFKKHDERDFLLQLSPEEYEVLYMRSHFVCSSEDFKARKCEQPFASTVPQRLHLTDTTSSKPVIQC